MQEPPPGLAELVRSAQGGDQLAVGRLLDLITPYVRRLCGPIALDDGADATQEALIVVFRKLRQLQDPAALYGWVRAIAVREAVRCANRAARSRPAELGEVPAPAIPISPRTSATCSPGSPPRTAPCC
ncbi:RNA polymerase sigma factor [Kitasatospora aureofaciens]|uniref:RNA polymerase sigma factor n=1 Tax=Kitasatospora aureofaciens TaxID=1894 RepID=UPI0033EC8FB0